MVAAVVVVIAIVILAVTLAYLFQPIRGRGSVSSKEILEGTSVEFDFNPTQGVGPYEYLWSFGDGSTSPEKNPIHTHDTIGTYTATVTVSNWIGVKCSWTTSIVVRLPLVFIDSVSYPSVYSAPLGDTSLVLYIDGARVSTGASIQPGTTHNIRLQIQWVMDWGFLVDTMTIVDDSGVVIAPTTTTDLHCVLVYDPYGDTKFALSSA